MKYCALCCIAKDEDRFLKEWLTYHALIGFEHFYIYDNLSRTPIADLLRGWIRPDQVTIIRNPHPLNQEFVYTHCLEHFGRQQQWIAFLDVDEFIRLAPESGPADIRLFLGEFEPYAAVGLNWRTFTSSGHESAPDMPVIGAYTRTLGDDAHIKSVVQPHKVRGCAGPHSFYPRKGEYAVNAAHFPLPPGFPFAVPATERAAVHHYFYKSRECFACKIARGNPCDMERRMQDFDRHLSLPDRADTSLAVWAPRVAALLDAPAGTMHQAAAPKTPPGLPPPENAEGHLHAAGYFLNRRKQSEALLHLCYASLMHETSVCPDPVIALDVWTLRAQAALQENDLARAECCLRRAFTWEAGYKAFGLLADILLRTGRGEAAKSALNIVRIYAARAGRGEDPADKPE